MTRQSQPMDPSMLSPEEFLRSLDQVPWFSHLGEPNARDHQVARIRDWEEWPGPESSQVRALGPRGQSLRDELIEVAGVRKAEVEAWWERIRQAVFQQACGAVPYDPEEDTWHGPTAAVCHAAWVAGLVGCGLLLGREIPSEATEQWSWFVEGHWPCGYAFDPEEGEPFVLLVL